jgi:hypothetical protein
MNTKTELSTVISTDANVDLQDIAAIFLSKYETDLYELKKTLTTEIHGLASEIELLTGTVVQKTDFSRYEKLGIPELELITEISDKPEVKWERQAVVVSVSLISTERSASKRPLMNKDVEKPILKPDLKKYAILTKARLSSKARLSECVTKISNMSRKEREIKGRISEQLLREKGLEHFVADAQMLQLISVD